MSQSVYETLINQVPAECITVPIIMECMLEEVVGIVDSSKQDEAELAASTSKKDSDGLGQFGEFEKFGRPDWGSTILEGGLVALPKRKSVIKADQTTGPTYNSPLYLKNGDFASIRSCHLNEIAASHIASTQIAGDLRNVQGLLYGDVPEFNKGLYIKLLGNLNHFMYFLPPDSVNFEDMFFILHLLMSAGVEVHLQKEAETAKAAEREKVLGPSGYFEMVAPEAEENVYEGTKLSKDNNYLAVNKATGMQFIMTPNAEEELSIIPLPDMERTSTPNKSKTKLAQDSKSRKKVKNQKSKTVPPKPPKDPVVESTEKAAGIAALRAFENAAEVASAKLAKISSNTDEEEVELEDEEFETEEEEEIIMQEVEVEEEIEQEEEEEEEKMPSLPRLPPPPLGNNFYFGTDLSNPNRYIACDEEWFKDINDASVFKSLLECPALLAISESGALDLSKWIQTYLLSSGMSQIGGDGMLIGQLKDWNFVEELVPVQTVQLLNEAVGNYLSMQRMYCPFYDTLLFIFNNPVPKSLKSESQFTYKLRTLPGHFFESAFNDEEVQKCLIKIKKIPGIEAIDTLSITSLLRLVPDEQWLLVPSIKYMLFKEKRKQETLLQTSKQAEIPNTNESPEEMLAFMKQFESQQKEPEILVTTPEGGDETEAPKTDEKSDRTKSSTAKERKSKAGGKVRKERSKSKSAAVEKEDKKEEKKEEQKEEKDDNKKKKKKPSANKEQIDDSATSKDKDSKSQKKKKQSRDSTTTESKGKKSKDIADGDQKNKQESEKKLSASSGDSAEIDAIPPFHFDNALMNKTFVPESGDAPRSEFECYDLGKRMVQIVSDTHHLYPMDSRIIKYDFSTIGPEKRMTQLSVVKNGHETFFYPCQFEKELTTKNSGSYVVCPYFHMVHANGTVFAFQDLRVTDMTPYFKTSTKLADANLFSYEKVRFGVDENNSEDKIEVVEVVEGVSGNENPRSPSGSLEESDAPITPLLPVGPPPTVSPEEEEEDEDAKDTGKKGTKKGKRLGKEKKSSDTNTKITKEEKPKKKGKEKSKKEKKKSNTEVEVLSEMDEEEEMQESEYDESIRGNTTSSPEEAATALEDTVDWLYSDGELTEAEEEEEPPLRRQSSSVANLTFTEVIMEPMMHSLKVTLPSGLVIEVYDSNGSPRSREVKQSYNARGSAMSKTESSRYYTMNGAVIKFMLSGTIQILTARGVTTNIRELATSAQQTPENIDESFLTAENIRIYNGEIILPSGEFWHIVDGKRQPHDPVYVFSCGPLPNGETFQRRQDGTVYLHRHDGTTVTHYPDGTRFTTRMIIQKDAVDAADDWVVVGLKYMIEHPNYSSVIFNTISSNMHVRLPHGDWMRVFADGSIKLSTIDNYNMDIDKERAVLSYPSCAGGDKEIPNLTAIKLYQTKDSAFIPEETESIRVLTGSSPESEGETTGFDPATSSTQSQSDSASEGQPKLVTESKTNVSNRKSLRRLSKVSQKAKSIKKRSMTTIETLDGEPLPEEVLEDEILYEMNEEEEEMMEFGDISSRPSQQYVTGKKFEIQEFLMFNDNETLLCKAIDSWDNRFAVDLYGETIVDRKEENDPTYVTDELIRALSDHCQLPREYVSGILRVTSSEELTSTARRIGAFKQSHVDTCTKVPPTRIFVIKRNLSGYEYFKQNQIDAISGRAKNCRESMVIVDPLPSRDPRKFITIMEPVSEIDKPKGMWTNIYREPIFRPASVTNKNLKISKPEDLRWFGYVLLGANSKRPKFVLDPRADFLRRKETGQLKSNESKKANFRPESQPKVIDGLDPEMLGDGIHPEGSETKVKSRKTKDKIERKEKGDKKGDKKDKGDKKEKSEKKESSIDKKDKVDKKQEKGKKGKDKGKGADEEDEEAKGKLKKNKSSKKNSKATDSSGDILLSSEILTQIQPGLEDEEEEMQASKKSIRAPNSEILDYPSDIPDLGGIYEDEQPMKIQPQFHADICTEKKAIVVRSFVEIPQIDDKLQRALLAASASYKQTVKTQVDIFENNTFKDPRSDEEKERQSEIQHQFIEQNLLDMHLLEQKPGRVLRFHF